MSILKSKVFHSALGLLVSLALIGWMVFAVEWREVGEQLHHINYLVFVWVTLVMFLHMGLRALRWRAFLPASEPVPTFMDLFDSIMLGCLATFILPLRAGEVVRPLLLSKKSGVPFATGLVSVIIERFFDLSAVLISFGLVVIYVPGVPEWVGKGASVLTVLAAMILVALLLGACAPKLIALLVARSTSVLPEKLRNALTKFTEDFLRGTVVLKDPVRLAKVFIFTVLVWLSNFFVYYLYIALVNVEPTPLLAVTLGVVLALAVAAPSLPGFLGVYQGGCVVGFALFGISRETAITCAIVSHFYQYVFIVLYGIIAMVRGGLGFRDLKASRQVGN